MRTCREAAEAIIGTGRISGGEPDRGSAVQIRFLSGGNLRGGDPVRMPPISSGEGESQEARAQQHKARRSQRQEPAGNCILVAHITPATLATLDAGPNCLKFSERPS